MDGPALLTYVQRRLAEQGLAVEADREAELYDLITEGRDRLQQAFAEVAPLVVATWVRLVPVAGDARRYRVPPTTADPLRVLAVRFADDPDMELIGGAYVWDDVRTLRVRAGASLGALEARAVFAGESISDVTTEREVGLPTPCHRALAKWAVVLALTADEESDAATATALFRDELERLERLYAGFDGTQQAADLGLALTRAMLPADAFGA